MVTVTHFNNSKTATSFAWLVVSLCLISSTGCGRSEKGAEVAARHLRVAEVYRAQGRLRASSLECQRARQLDQENPAVFMCLARIALDAGDGRSAESALSSAAALGWQADEWSLMLGEAYLRQGRVDPALSELERLADSELSADPRYLLVRGEAELTAGDIARAKTLFSRVGTHGQEGAKALVGLAKAALLESDPRTASAYLEQAVEAEPREPEIWMLRGRLALAEKDYVTAVEQFHRARQFDRTDMVTPTKIEATRGLIFANIARGRHEEAYRVREDFLDTYPGSLVSVFERAVEQFRAAELREAEQSLRHLLVRVPEHTPSVLLLGAVSYSQGDLEEAAALLEQAGDDASVAARKLLALSQLRLRKPHLAVQGLERALKNNASDGELRALLAQAYYASGDEEGARRELQSAVHSTPNDAGVRIVAADVYASLGDFQQAIDQLQRALQLDPQSHRAKALLVAAYLAAKRPREARALANEWVAEDPTEPTAHYSAGLVALGEPQHARQSFETATRLDSRFESAWLMLATLDLLEGMADSAMGRYETVLEFNPASVPAMRGYLLAATRSGTPQRGVDKIEEISRSNQAASPARLVLAEHYLLHNQPEEALPRLHGWLQDHPEDHGVRALLASSYAASGAIESAIREYARIREVQPDDAVIANNLAWLYFEAGDARAVDLAEDAYRLSPDDGEICDTLGWILVQKGDAARGVELLKKASRLLPDSEEVQKHLAIALRQTTSDRD